MVLLSRNWHCREGELDLVLSEGDRVVVISHRWRPTFRDPMG